MSNRALNWAFDSGLPSGARFVLVALADAGTDHSGEDWTCYPSVDRIMEMTGQGRSTVERHLTWLWVEGWISRKPRVRTDGTLGINDFTLHRRPETRDELKAVRAEQERRPGRRPSLDLRDGPSLDLRVSIPRFEAQPSLDLRGQEPSVEPLEEPSLRAREPGDDGFDEASKLWPQRGRKFTRWPAARAAWAAARQTESADRLRAAVLACAQDPDRARGDFGWPGLDVFFRDEIWREYLPSGVTATAETPRTAFAGPAELRAAIVAAKGEAFAVTYLDRAAFDAETGTLTAATGIARQRLGEVIDIITGQGATLAPNGG